MEGSSSPHRRRLALPWVAGSFVALGLASCDKTTHGSGSTASSGTGSSMTTTGSSMGGGGGAPTNPGQPPPAGPPKEATGQGGFLVISKLYFGTATANEWKTIGYDIDGKTSSGTSTDLCKPLEGLSVQQLYPDGDNGIDNSWGKLVLPLTLAVDGSFATAANQAVAQGKYTLLFYLEGLGLDTDTNPLDAKVYAGGLLGKAPNFDGTDVWPILSDSLVTPTDVTTAKLQLPGGYLAGNTWVGRSKNEIVLPLPSMFGVFDVRISAAVITMELSPDRKSATHGVISGVIDTQSYTDQIKKRAGAKDMGLCGGQSLANIVAQIRQASDILHGGGQNPALDCDGISIGLGFDAADVTLGPIQDPVPPADGCP
jgi:hypothetical protein